MTPERLAEIKAKTEAAPAAPWQVEFATKIACEAGTIHVDMDRSEDDVTASAFVSLARSAIPELLAEVERLRAEVAACDEKVKKAVVEAWEDALR